ncbi:P68 family surface lipoprotein [Mycoplasma crocodyli]|uniref:Putative membrane lipoprotein P80 n=1 Tax=Mycoplasma crocodyli (strain ATCC 51981 / MP145) TaxID=512564 RepID=D5E6B5_MYCCM|nr:P80 family lipoprotein [Mycoplasma crocodyli]ADE19354.1 putative membrane lipoprotein P80 [Mycoplasma crocodyli MP145]
MKLKSKKMIIGSATVLALTATAVSAISCGVNRFDTNDDNKVVIGVGLSKTGPQIFALEQLAEIYNNTEKDTPDFVPVSVESLGNSYGDVTSKVVQYMKVADKKQLPNMLLAYPTALASIAGYKMELNLADKTVTMNGKDKKETPVGDQYGITRNLFEEDFMTFNDRIAKVVPGNISALPFAKSSLVTALNGPVLSYVIETMTSNGATIKAEDKDFFDKIIAAGKGDRNYVVNLWGKVVEAEAKKSKDYVISREIFNNGTTLIDFAVRAQNLFENSKQNPKGSLHMLGIDDIAGFLATEVFAMTAKEKNDFKEFYIKLKEGNFIDYKPYEQKDTLAYKSLSKIAKTLLEAARQGAIYIGGNGAYSSTFQVKHQIGFAIGSTAGHDHNIKAEAKLGFDYSIEKVEIQYNTIWTLTQLGEQGTPNLVAEITQGKYKNKLFNSKATPKGKHDLFLATEKDDKDFADAIKNLDLNKNPMIFLGNKTLDNILAKDENQKHVKELGIVSVNTKSETSSEITKLYIVPNETTLNDKSFIVKFKLTTEGTVQKGELFVTNAPRKWEATDAMNAVYLQGPSLIAIHGNEKEDKATRKFIKWVTDTSKKFKFKFRTQNGAIYYLDKDGKMVYEKTKEGVLVPDAESKSGEFTALEYVSLQASYIVPYKGALEKPDKKANIFVKQTYEDFKKAITEAGWSLVEEPADSLTDAYRNVIVSTWKSPFTSILNGTENEPLATYENSILPKINSQSSPFDR